MSIEFFIKIKILTYILEKFAEAFKAKFEDNVIAYSERNLAIFEEGYNFYLPPKNLENEYKNIHNFLRALGISKASVNKEFSTLSPKELQCLDLIGAGFTIKEIAQKLLLSPRTIETHLNHIKTKTGICYKSELVKFYRSNQLIY